MLDSLIQDVRLAVRGLRRTPLFTLGTALTIGLGLGILGSGFTILNAYVLKPLDLPNPHQLYDLSWDSATTRRHRFTPDDVEALRRDARHFSGLIAGETVQAMYAGQPGTGLLVSGEYFTALGARPALGRLLTPADTAPAGGAVVVLANHFWQTRFGGDPAILGTRIQLGHVSFEVVGVDTPGHKLPGTELIDFWIPSTMASALRSSGPPSEQASRAVTVVARLRPDVSAAQARAWFETWLKQRFPAPHALAPIAVRLESRASRIPVNPRMMALLSLLMAALALVLFIACANVTSLLLARALGRQRETAMRLALGASRWRVGRLLIVEGLVLAVPAAAVGFLLSLTTARVFPTLIVSTFPAGVLPIERVMAPLDPDLRVLVMLALFAVVAAVLVSLLPARQATRVQVMRVGGNDASGGHRSRLRTALIVMQVAACVLFIVGAAGLVDQSSRFASANLGLSYERVAEVSVAPALRVPLADRLAADPTIERVAVASRRPWLGPLPEIVVRTKGTKEERAVGHIFVSAEYFPLFDIRIVRGRGFTAQESATQAPVVLVSELTARTLWPGSDPVGQTLDLVSPVAGAAQRPAHTAVQVIGVTADVVNGNVIDGRDPSCVYFTISPDTVRPATVLVRGRGDLTTLRTAVATAVDAVERNAAFQFFGLRPLIGALVWVIQAFLTLATLLGAVGLIFACSGTYAVVAFLVARRTREFGVRMALGASVRQLVTGLLAETLRTAGYGVAIGLVAAIAIGRVGRAVIPIAPVITLRHVFIGAAVMLAASLVAALIPSLRTMRLDPWKALRVE